MFSDLSINEIIAYGITAISAGWAFREAQLRRKGEKQKIKYLTYSKVSENVNFISKKIDTLRLTINLVQLKKFQERLYDNENKLVEIKSNQKARRNTIESIIQKGEDETKKIKELISLIKSIPIENKEEISTQSDKITADSELVKGILDDSRNLLTNNTDELDNFENALSAHKNDIINFKKSLENDIYQLNQDIDTFLLGFNDISDLQIVSSRNVLLQVNFVKSKGEELKNYLAESILKHEKFPDVSDIITSEQFKQLQIENNKLLFIMRDEIRGLV